MVAVSPSGTMTFWYMGRFWVRTSPLHFSSLAFPDAVAVLITTVGPTAPVEASSKDPFPSTVPDPISFPSTTNLAFSVHFVVRAELYPTAIVLFVPRFRVDELGRVRTTLEVAPGLMMMP